jgi:hypothetical protein
MVECRFSAHTFFITAVADPGIPVTERPIALPPVTTGARYANAAIPERREV